MLLVSATALLLFNFVRAFPQEMNPEPSCNPGDVWAEGKIKMECYADGVRPVSCVPNGFEGGAPVLEIAPGQTWTGPSFKYQCTSNEDQMSMSLDIIACVLPNKTEFEIGTQVGVANKGLYKCVRNLDNTVARKLSQGCFFNGRLYTAGQYWIFGTGQINCVGGNGFFESKASGCLNDGQVIKLGAYAEADGGYFKCVANEQNAWQADFIKVSDIEYREWLGEGGGEEEEAAGGDSNAGYTRPPTTTTTTEAPTTTTTTEEPTTTTPEPTTSTEAPTTTPEPVTTTEAPIIVPEPETTTEAPATVPEPEPETTTTEVPTSPPEPATTTEKPCKCVTEPDEPITELITTEQPNVTATAGSPETETQRPTTTAVYVSTVPSKPVCQDSHPMCPRLCQKWTCPQSPTFQPGNPVRLRRHNKSKNKNSRRRSGSKSGGKSKDKEHNGNNQGNHGGNHGSRGKSHGSHGKSHGSHGKSNGSHGKPNHHGHHSHESSQIKDEKPNRAQCLQLSTSVFELIKTFCPKSCGACDTNFGAGINYEAIISKYNQAECSVH